MVESWFGFPLFPNRDRKLCYQACTDASRQFHPEEMTAVDTLLCAWFWHRNYLEYLYVIFLKSCYPENYLVLRTTFWHWKCLRVSFPGSLSLRKSRGLIWLLRIWKSIWRVKVRLSYLIKTPKQKDDNPKIPVPSHLFFFFKGPHFIWFQIYQLLSCFHHQRTSLLAEPVLLS